VFGEEHSWPTSTNKRQFSLPRWKKKKYKQISGRKSSKEKKRKENLEEKFHY